MRNLPKLSPRHADPHDSPPGVAYMDGQYLPMSQAKISVLAQVTDILHNCVALSGLENAYVEFICTRGASPNFSRDPREAVNRFIGFAIPFSSVANEQQKKHGLEHRAFN